MPDKYRIKSNSNILIKQARDILDKIGDNIRDKNLSKSSEVIKEMLEGLKNMFTEIGKPKMKKRYAPIDGPPWSEDYNKTMKEIQEDLNTSYDEMQSLEDGVITDFNFNKIQRTNINNRIGVLKERLNDFVLFTNIDNDLVHAKDMFNNLDMVDVKGTSGSRAAIDTDNGVVSLSRAGSENLSPNMNVDIVKTNSNGFPGNLHQVKNANPIEGGQFEPIKRKDPEWMFYGEEDMHLVPETVLDNNPDTWFEYECCDIPESKKKQQKHFGFTYEDGEQWSRDPAEPYKRDGQAPEIQDNSSTDSFLGSVNNAFNGSGGIVGSALGSIHGSSLRKIGRITGSSGIFGKLFGSIKNSKSSNSGNRNKNQADLSKPLRLNLELSFEEAQIANWINVNPHVPPFDGSTAPRVVNIFISDGDEYKRSIVDETYKDLRLSEELNESPATYEEDEIPSGDNFTGQAVYTFPPSKTETISIIIEQEAPYDCRIGHIYYQRVDKIKTEETGPLGGIFGGNDTSYETKKTYVEGPKVKLGVLYTDWDDKLGITDLGEGTFAEPLTDLVGGISGFVFGSEEKSLVSSNIESGINGFEGWRWAIGIKGINVFAYEFEQTSEIVSKEHIIGYSIKRISLTVNEEIPKSFVTNDNYEKRNDWIKYYVSVDGNQWHRISPESHGETIENGDIVPEVYVVNSEVSEENRNPNTGYIDLEKDAATVRFKAILSRPTSIEDAEHFTPVLRGYALKMQTEGEVV